MNLIHTAGPLRLWRRAAVRSGLNIGEEIADGFTYEDLKSAIKVLQQRTVEEYKTTWRLSDHIPGFPDDELAVEPEFTCKAVVNLSIRCKVYGLHLYTHILDGNIIYSKMEAIRIAINHAMIELGFGNDVRKILVSSHHDDISSTFMDSPDRYHYELLHESLYNGDDEPVEGFLPSSRVLDYPTVKSSVGRLLWG